MAESLCRVGELDICYETFGDPSDPAMLMIMGLGTQMLAWHEDFCSELADRGFFVIRHDNRDIGRSTRLKDAPTPTLLQLARRLHEEHVREGIEKRDALIAEGHATAARVVAEAEAKQRQQMGILDQERLALEKRVDELRIFERDYRTRLKSYLQNLLGDLDNRGSALPSGGSSGQDKQGI